MSEITVRQGPYGEWVDDEGRVWYLAAWNTPEPADGVDRELRALVEGFVEKVPLVAEVLRTSCCPTWPVTADVLDTWATKARAALSRETGAGGPWIARVTEDGVKIADPSYIPWRPRSRNLPTIPESGTVEHEDDDEGRDTGGLT